MDANGLVRNWNGELINANYRMIAFKIIYGMFSCDKRAILHPNSHVHYVHVALNDTIRELASEECV